MHANRGLQVLSFFFIVSLSFSPKVWSVLVPTQKKGFCQSEDQKVVICNVRCLKDILDLLPQVVTPSKVEDLIVHQFAIHCDTEIALEAVEALPNLRRFYYTGLICPFTELPRLPQLVHLSFSTIYMIDPIHDKFKRRNESYLVFPTLTKMVVSEICCFLFQGTIALPQVEELTFRCAQPVSQITNGSEQKGDLVLIAPRVKFLDYYENGWGFPVSSLSSLPLLRRIFVVRNTDVIEEDTTKFPSVNLPSLRELVFTQVVYNNTMKLPCVDLGEAELRQVALINVARGLLSCPSVWRCTTCHAAHKDASPKKQSVHIIATSLGTTRLSYLLPNVTLNTSDLVVDHFPLLQLDGEAMRRFAHLRKLHVGEASMNYSTGGNGVVTMVDNPFRALQRPELFQSLRLVLQHCGCDEYETFVWLKKQNPTLVGEIKCLWGVTGRLTNEWLSVDDVISRSEGRCAGSPSIDVPKPFVSNTPNSLVVRPMLKTIMNGYDSQQRLKPLFGLIVSLLLAVLRWSWG